MPVLSDTACLDSTTKATFAARSKEPTPQRPGQGTAKSHGEDGPKSLFCWSKGWPSADELELDGEALHRGVEVLEESGVAGAVLGRDAALDLELVLAGTRAMLALEVSGHARRW